MTMQAAVTAQTEDATRTIAALVTAFADDPFIRWMFPDAHQYLSAFPLVLKYFAGAAFEHGTAYRSDDFSAACLWLQPGIAPDEDGLGQVMQHWLSTSSQEQIFAVMEQVGSGQPEEPHWYLPAMGVDPRCQGEGKGSALLHHSLNSCDQVCRLAYLESTNPENIPFYQRLGFEVIGTIQIDGSPVLTRMLRERA
ncbi:MAG: GNAT family N-acetyltransferase [Dinoroseobacter sp.]|nr:GNAT family N-acetyltransferase [Dinoroseobacter sp.]